MNMLGCNRIKKEAEEPNPKTLHLAKLVQLIEPTVLAYYLEQVSAFLKSKKKDLWFPLISPNLDAFLVRMIQDTHNLKSLLHVLDDKNRELAIDIIETLEANKNVYTVVYSYSNSNTDKNTLVYRKVVDMKPPESAVFDRIERMCNASPEQSSTPEETSERKPPEVTRRCNFPVSFKLQWINATLRFIKDTTVDCMEYPDMTIEQAEFVYSLIRQKKTDNDTDPSIQSVYVPMKKALREFNVDNEFKATFTYLCGDKVRLSLEKLPLNNNNNMKHKPELNGNSNPLDLDNLTKAQKNLARKTNMVKLLEPSFIRTALQMILDFIHEDTEASIVFRNANEEQCAFLQSALAMAKARKLHGVFDEDSRNLLRKIAKLLSTCQYFDLKIDVAKMDRSTALRTVSLIKTPKEEFRAPTFVPSTENPASRSPSVESIDRKLASSERINPTPTTSTNNVNAQTIPNGKLASKCPTANNIKTEKDLKEVQNTNMKMRKVETKEDSKVLKIEETISKVTEPATSTCIPNGVKPIDNQNQVKAEKEKTPEEKKPTVDSSKTVDTVDSKTIDKKTTEQVKSTSNDKKSLDGLKPAGTIDLKTIDKKTTEQGKTTEQEKTINNKTIDPAQAVRDQSGGKGLGLRKTRLIEGLSTPLESDVAMRMMRQMGWEGGPLGARGEGLLEPVMPAIHLKTGAGLGHVVPKKEPKPKPQKPTPPPQKPANPQNQPKLLSKTIHCHKPQNIRLDLLRHIFLLITEDPLERIIFYSTKLAKKELKFLENTLKVILRRGALIFNDDVMQSVYERIKEQMVSEPELQLSCFVGGDKRSFVIAKSLQKIDTVENAIPITTQNATVECVTSIARKYLDAEIITTEIITLLGKQVMPNASTKSAKSLGHRIIILNTILDLINSDDTEKIIKFDYSMTCKKITYIKEILSSMNNRMKWSYSTSFENYLAVKVLDAMKDTMYIGALFANNNQHLTFQKIIHKSRVTNSTAEPKVDSLESTNNNNNNIVSKETTKPDENDKNDIANVNDKDNAKNDAKTVNNDIIVISDSDDNESIKKSSGKSDGKSSGSSQNSSFESEFEREIKDADKEEIKVDDKNDSEEAKKHESNGYSNGACSKRLRSNSDESDKNQKKTKINGNVKYLGIAPDSYPMENVGVDEIITFQNKICEKLDNTKEKPLLECLGIKNGAIIYCCHNEFGRFLIESVANDMNLKTINITNLYKNKRYKVKARINSYVEIDLKDLFDKVEVFNVGLKTDSWSVSDVQAGTGHVTMSMEIDEKSFDLISESNFSIFAGVDKLRFNVSWE